MNRFVRKVEAQSFSLMVSIPRNHRDMAKAAESAGADSIKVHLNCKHPASGHDFGSLAKEKKNIQAVLKSVLLPVGVVPGAESPATVSELAELKKMGIDFFDIFAHHLPLDYLKTDFDLGRMICIDSRYTPADVKRLAVITAELFECSVIPHKGYGKPVTLSDLIVWSALAERVRTPMLVSTQRKIKPEECEDLKGVGMRGIVIGVVVTGETVKGVHEVTRKFRKAIDRM